MIKMQKILVVTPSIELALAFKNAFAMYDVDIQHVSNYTEAICIIQEHSIDLLITEYFLEAGNDIESAFETRNWEVDLIEYDMRRHNAYQNDLVWLRSEISMRDKEKLFPLGRRLSIDADLFMVKNIILWDLYDKPFYQDQIEGIALYLSEYGRYLYYSMHKPDITSKEFCKFVRDKKFLDLKKVY